MIESQTSAITYTLLHTVTGIMVVTLNAWLGMVAVSLARAANALHHGHGRAAHDTVVGARCAGGWYGDFAAEFCVPVSDILEQ